MLTRGNASLEMAAQTGQPRAVADQDQRPDAVRAEMEIALQGRPHRRASWAYDPVTPAGRGRGAHTAPHAHSPPVSKHLSMTWMQRLKRVFAIEIETCQRCGGRLRVIASIEDPLLIERILAHRDRTEEESLAPFASRAPPYSKPSLL
jgi:hypothetical protein